MQEVTLGGPCIQLIEVGDVLTYIDNVCVTGMKLEDLVRYSHGEEGTTVELTIKRGKSKGITNHSFSI